MPTYNFHNTKTDEKWTEYMSISEMEEFIKKKHIKLLNFHPTDRDNLPFF